MSHYFSCLNWTESRVFFIFRMFMLAFEQKRIRMLFRDLMKGFYFVTLFLCFIAYCCVFLLMWAKCVEDCWKTVFMTATFIVWKPVRWVEFLVSKCHAESVQLLQFNFICFRLSLHGLTQERRKMQSTENYWDQNQSSWWLWTVDLIVWTHRM